MQNVCYSARFQDSATVWDVRSSATLHAVDWRSFIDVLEQYVCLIFKSEALQNCWALAEGTERLYWNVDKLLPFTQRIIPVCN